MTRAAARGWRAAGDGLPGRHGRNSRATKALIEIPQVPVVRFFSLSLGFIP